MTLLVTLLTTHRSAFACLFLCSGFLLTGCSESSTHGTVHGTVTLDDAPLAEGTVEFFPEDKTSQTAAAIVSEGKFTATVPIGSMRVKFSAPKVVGQRKMYDSPDSPKVDIVHELLPPRYNIQTELTLDVQLGSQDAPFELSSK
jgi:hypothetical protein